jgi:glycosyltransferase involved in cell wall biosynthesis
MARKRRAMEHQMSTSDSLRILHVIAPGPFAGAEKSALASVDALCTAGYDVSVAVVREARKPGCAAEFLRHANALGLETKVFSTRTRLDFSLSHRLSKYVHDERFDIVHSHNYKALVHLAMFRRAIPGLIATYHGATSHTLSVQLYEWLDWILFQKADCVFAVSDGARDTLLERGAFRTQIAVVQNFVTPPDSVSANGALENGRLQLLFLGRLSHEKGLDILLNALSTLDAGLFFLRVVGDGPCRDALEAQAKALHLEPSVRFFGFHREVHPFLAQSNVLVMPSRTEAMPMALIEAATVGMPVIASAVGGIPEIVVNHRNGILVEPEDVADLRDAIIEMASRFEQFRDHSLKDADKIADQFSAKQWIALSTREYREVLRSKEPDAAIKGA